MAETIAAIATPLGVGGIGVVRVSGPSAAEVALQSVRLPNGTARPKARHATLVQIVDRAAGNRLVDEALLLLMPGPASYTGEDVVELSCHGGPVVVRRVLDLMLAAGARPAEPGEFTLRAFLNGRLDLAQAEAVADMVEAPTTDALAVAANQLAGRLSDAVRTIRSECLDLLAQMEAEVDFAEEDVPPLPRETVRARLESLDERLAEILRGADRGILQRHGVRVALVGSPNVGKSSLMNALLATDRAIVTEFPGTTRDALEETFNLDGIPVVLTDTAGMRDTTDPVESIGVERSARALSGADLAVLVLDAGRAPTPADRDAAASVRHAGKPTVVALNKRDLPAVTSTEQAGALAPGARVCHTCAIAGDVNELRLAIAGAIDTSAPNGDLATVASVRHKHALGQAREELAGSRRALDEELPSDLITVGLHGAITRLGEITGESATEDLLDTIFSKFCIGK